MKLDFGDMILGAILGASGLVVVVLCLWVVVEMVKEIFK